MPTTVNGIGTHYYGKKNLQVRPGICGSCGRQTELSSYDTRLWFVIVYVPVVPLGRKRIIDECPLCLRHRVTSQHDWEMLSQLNISGAMEKYTSNPSVETALETHATLLSFRKMDEAQQIRSAFQERYPDNATLFSGLAAQLCAMGQIDQALPLFEKAHTLNPEMPEARMGVAHFRLAQGRLDEARELLAHLEKPGAGQTHSLEPLEELAQAYQKKGRHAEVLALCKRLMEELPHIGEIHAFRKFVGTSERALGVTESMLPERSFSIRKLLDSKSGAYPKWQRNLVIGAVVTLLVAVSFVVHNEYIRRHRTVHILNAFPQAAQVAIDDGAPIDVQQMETAAVSEGKHQVKVAGPIEESFEIDVSSGYFARWRSSPAWVINVGGAAALVHTRMFYAVDPLPPEVKLLIGESFVALPQADYLFVDPPKSLTVDSKSEKVVKIHLARVNAPPIMVFNRLADVFNHAVDEREAAAALRYAESHIVANPEDDSLLSAYAEKAKSSGQRKRAEEFLKRGCRARPVSVAWHREYQSLDMSAERETALAAEYDAELKKEPDNAALLYLRGRVTPDHTEAHRYFERAAKVDPKLGWAWYALALDTAGRGDWKATLEHVHRLKEMPQQAPGWHHFIHVIRLAAGETKALEAEYRKEMASEPQSFVVLYLCDALGAQGKTDEAKQALDKWLNVIPPAFRNLDEIQRVHRLCLYTNGDLGALEKANKDKATPQTKQIWMETLNALGRPAEVIKDPALAEELRDAHSQLEVSVAFAMINDQAAAGQWRNRACGELDQMGIEERKLAAVLRSNQPPTRAQLDDLIFLPGQKALLVVALAQRFPEKKKELLEYAQQFNVSHLHPYLLVRKAMDSMK